MNRKDMQRAFGNADDAFRLRLRQTLDGLEEKEMKKKYRLSTVLIAAVLLIAVLAGAGIAMTQMGIFDFFRGPGAIVPLEGAEEMVATNLGTSENEYAVLTVEEAVFDGQGVMVKCRLTPKDAEKYVLFDAFMQDAPEDTYITENVQIEIPEGEHELASEIGCLTLVNENGVQRLLLNEEEVEIPEGLEAAQQAGLPVYRMDGKLYDAHCYEFRVHGRRDGKEIMDYGISCRAENDLVEVDSADAREEADGSIIWWESGMAYGALGVNELKVNVTSRVFVNDQPVELPEISFTLPKTVEERSYSIVAEDPTAGGNFENVGGSMVFTRVRGYITIGCSYGPEYGDELDVDFHLYDENRQEIPLGSGRASDENGVFTWHMEMQSMEEVPETVYIGVKHIGEAEILEMVKCRVIEK